MTQDMKCTMDIKRSILEATDEIMKILGVLKQSYPEDFEFILHINGFSGDDLKISLTDHNLVNNDNIEYHIEVLRCKKIYLDELSRWEGLTNLPKFRVICVSEDSKPDLLPDCMWIEENCEYFVSGIIRDDNGNNLAFRLQDLNGKDIGIFDSWKFNPINYESLN